MAVKHRYITAFPTLSVGMLAQKSADRQGCGLWNGNVIFLSSARAAAFHAVRHFGIQVPCKVLVPSYHCGVEIEAMLRAGAGIEYYAVGRDMRVDTEDVVRRVRPEVRALFVVHYWGFPQDISALVKICRDHNLALIEDCAHALYSGHGNTPLGISGDASIYSLPKTLAAPDGGVLRLKGEGVCPEASSRRKDWLALKAGVRSLLENLRTGRQRPVAQVADSLVAMRQWVKRQPDNCWDDYGETRLSMYNHGVSGLSTLVLQRSSGDTIRSRRRRNYARLVEALRGTDELEPLFKQLEEGVCPLFLPAIVEDRDGLEEYLSRNRIRTFVFGRKLHPTLDRDRYPDAHFLSGHVLGLPVHQDLDDDDMKAIEETTREWIGG